METVLPCPREHKTAVEEPGLGIARKCFHHRQMGMRLKRVSVGLKALLRVAVMSVSRL